MVGVSIELPIAVYEWFDQMARSNHFNDVSEYIQFSLIAKHAESSRGAVEGAFIYTTDNQ